MRTLFVLLLLNVLASPLYSQPPTWLPEVAVAQSSNDAVPTTVEPVPAFANIEQLQAYQRKVLSDWSSYLGAFDPTQRAETAIHWKESIEQEAGLVRSRIEYETEPGQWTEAFILRPSKQEATQKFPAVVVFHSTVENSLYQPVGLSGPNASELVAEDELRKAFALHLARRGYVTLSPRNYLWPAGLGISATEEAAKFKQRQPQRKGMARMLLDSLRAVDLLSSLEGVDSQRIGAIGHSLGAKDVLYLAAFDARVKAAVSCEGGLGIHQSNWNAPWYLDSECLKPEFRMDHHQLLAAVAPRAFMLIGGDASDGVASLPLLQQASKAYITCGSPENLAFYNHRQGHQVTAQSLQRSLEWLDWHLKQ